MCVQPRGDGVYRGGWWEVPDRPRGRRAGRRRHRSWATPQGCRCGGVDSAGSPEQRRARRRTGVMNPARRAAGGAIVQTAAA